MAGTIEGKGKGQFRARTKQVHRRVAKGSSADALTEVANGSADKLGSAQFAAGPAHTQNQRAAIERKSALNPPEPSSSVLSKVARTAMSDQFASAGDGSASSAGRVAETENSLIDARAILAHLQERVANIASRSNAAEQSAFAPIWGDLARCDEKLAQAQSRQHSLQSDGADARRTLDAVRANIAVLEKKLERVTAELEAEKRGASELAARTEVDLTSAVEAAARETELRSAALERRARIREATLKQSAADAEFNGRLKFELLNARANSLQLQQDKVAHLIRSLGTTRHRLAMPLDLLIEDPSAIPVGPKTTQTAVAWLASQTEHCMRPDASASFEVAASREWGDETFVSGAYAWLLGRPVDDNGLDHYCSMLRTRMLHVEVLLDLAQSQEALSKLRQGAHVVADANADFVRSAYRALLGRSADQGGFDHYLTRLEGPATRASVILDLARSDDAIKSGTPLSAAIRFIWFVDRWPNRFRRRLQRFRFGRAAAQRRLWTATRFAALDYQIAASWTGSRESLDALANLSEQRVAAAHQVVAASLATASPSATETGPAAIDRSGGSSTTLQVPGHGKAMDVSGFEAGASNCLKDTSHLRHPAQIVALIHDELKYLGAK